MRKNKTVIYKWVFPVFLLCLLSCSTTNYVGIETDMANKPSLNLDQFDQIIITDFLLKKEKPDFDLNKEIKIYLAQEIQVRTDKKANTESFSPENENSFQKKDFWIQAGSKENKGIYLTGSIEYKSEVRKALVKDKRKFEDPFQDEDRFVQRKQYSLVLDLYLIDSQTGEVLYQRKLNESKAYQNPNQTSYFAFYDLIYRVKEKIFRDFFDVKSNQNRYLLIK